MALKVYTLAWSPRAEKSYHSILDYIGEEFGDAYVKMFVRRTMTLLEHVVRNPAIFRKSDLEKNKHIVVVTKQTTLYFRLKPRKREVKLYYFGTQDRILKN